MNYTLNEINDAAKWLIEHIGEHRILALSGQMGAGKTTLIRAVCDVLGTDDVVTSPTFALVNEYDTSSDTFPKVYHFDFYRIKRPEEAYDIGIEEYFDSGMLCMIEWPEMIDSLLPSDAVTLKIEEQPDGSRELSLDIAGNTIV